MRAHAPGSVTTIFRPAADASEGVSIATADGVTADVSLGDETRLVLDGEPASVEAVELALADLDISAEVRLTTAVPIGAGFGVSGAATLATVLAAAAEADRGWSRERLVDTAHRAEVEAGTGLGDVFVQARGGLVWNTGEGIQRRSLSGRLGYVTHGGIETASVLDDEAALTQVGKAAGNVMGRFDSSVDLRTLLSLSWEFAEATPLVTPAVAETVAAVQAEGGVATMAMVGETVIGTGPGTEQELPTETEVATRGAQLLE